MKEREFQKKVMDEFKKHGWIVKHCPTPMRPLGGGRWAPDPRGRGMLDLMMTHPDPARLVIAECKNETGELSDDQREMLRLLRGVADRVREQFRPDPCPIGIYVFQPANWELIAAIARGGSLTI